VFERVSLLKSEGHAEASLYPLWYLSMENEIAVIRINSNLRTKAALASQAYASVKSKKGAKEFKKTLEKLG
jgi:hypothetical protein